MKRINRGGLLFIVIALVLVCLITAENINIKANKEDIFRLSEELIGIEAGYLNLPEDLREIKKEFESDEEQMEYLQNYENAITAHLSGLDSGLNKYLATMADESKQKSLNLAKQLIRDVFNNNKYIEGSYFTGKFEIDGEAFKKNVKMNAEMTECIHSFDVQLETVVKSNYSVYNSTYYLSVSITYVKENGEWKLFSIEQSNKYYLMSI